MDEILNSVASLLELVAQALPQDWRWIAPVIVSIFLILFWFLRNWSPFDGRPTRDRVLRKTYQGKLSGDAARVLLDELAKDDGERKLSALGADLTFAALNTLAGSAEGRLLIDAYGAAMPGAATALIDAIAAGADAPLPGAVGARSSADARMARSHARIAAADIAGLTWLDREAARAAAGSTAPRPDDALMDAHAHNARAGYAAPAAAAVAGLARDAKETRATAGCIAPLDAMTPTATGMRFAWAPMRDFVAALARLFTLDETKLSGRMALA